MRLNRQAFGLLLVLVATALSGCVSDPHREFRGTITRGMASTNAPSVDPIGLDFQCLDPKFADALTGFGISQGSIFFIHDRQKYVNDDYRLTNGAVSAVYFSESGFGVNQNVFLGENITNRDTTAGVHRLQGSFNVEKWKSDGDFRIRLAMHSSETNPVVVNGVLTSYNRWKFNPIEAFFLMLDSMGIAGE